MPEVLQREKSAESLSREGPNVTNRINQTSRRHLARACQFTHLGGLPDLCRLGVAAAASTAAAPSTYASRLRADFFDDFRPSPVPPLGLVPPFVAPPPPPLACAPAWDPFARVPPFVTVVETVVASVASSPNTSHMAGLTDESASRKDAALAFLGMTLLNVVERSTPSPPGEDEPSSSPLEDEPPPGDDGPPPSVSETRAKFPTL